MANTTDTEVQTVPVQTTPQFSDDDLKNQNPQSKSEKLSIKSKVNEYVKNGNPVFVYSLQGDISKYKESQKEYFRVNEEGEALYFSNRLLEPGQELKKTNSGRFQVLQDLEATYSELETETTKAVAKLNAISQFTGLGKKKLAERLLANF